MIGLLAVPRAMLIVVWDVYLVMLVFLLLSRGGALLLSCSSVLDDCGLMASADRAVTLPDHGWLALV